jgi:hypothetical protein
VNSDVLIKDGVAVFVGDKTTGRSKLDNIWQMELRLFAAKAPGPPMDITSEVIGRWAKESGKDVTTAVKAASLLGAQINTNRLSCHFEFNGGVLAGADIILDWSQILEITREVKGKSVERKDPELRVIYLEKEFNAESQN